MIIPTYNGSMFIAETIQSALDQTYGNIEVVVVNDGSTDNTKDIVNKFIEKDKRVKLINQVNGNVSKARNNGIENSKGEYIALLDHDDLWLSNKLEKQIPLFKEGVVLVYSRGYGLDNANNRFLLKGKGTPRRGVVLDRLCRANFIPCMSAVILKEAMVKLDEFFDPDINMLEEYELFIRLAMVGKFDFVDEPLAIARVHENNLTFKKPYFFPHDFSYVIDKHKDNLSNKNLRNIANLYLYFIANELGRINRRYYCLMFFTASFKNSCIGFVKLLFPAKILKVLFTRRS